MITSILPQIHTECKGYFRCFVYLSMRHKKPHTDVHLCEVFFFSLCYEALAALSFLPIEEIDADGDRNHQNQYDSRIGCAARGNGYLICCSLAGSLCADILRSNGESCPDNDLFFQRSRVSSNRGKNRNRGARIIGSDDQEGCLVAFRRFGFFRH